MSIRYYKEISMREIIKYPNEKQFEDVFQCEMHSVEYKKKAYYL